MRDIGDVGFRLDETQPTTVIFILYVFTEKEREDECAEEAN